MPEHEESEFEDDLDEEIEQEVQEEKKPRRTPRAKAEEPAEEAVAEEPKERFVPFARPESFGVMDTVTEEVVAGTERELQTTPEQLVELRLKALELNELDQIKNSLGA